MCARRWVSEGQRTLANLPQQLTLSPDGTQTPHCNAFACPAVREYPWNREQRHTARCLHGVLMHRLHSQYPPQDTLRAPVSELSLEVHAQRESNPKGEEKTLKWPH